MRKAGGRGGGPGGVPGSRCSGAGVCVLRRPLRSGTARQQSALNALPEETCPPFPPFLFSSAGGEGRGSRALRWGGQRRPALRLGPPLSPGRPADSPPWRGEVGLRPSPLCLLLRFSRGSFFFFQIERRSPWNGPKPEPREAAAASEEPEPAGTAGFASSPTRPPPAATALVWHATRVPQIHVDGCQAGFLGKNPRQAFTPYLTLAQARPDFCTIRI